MLGIELKAKLGDEIGLGLQKADVQKVENHAHSVALFAMYYNFVRIHKTLRTTPAMAAGVTKRLWEVGDMVECSKRGSKIMISLRQLDLLNTTAAPRLRGFSLPYSKEPTNRPSIGLT